MGYTEMKIIDTHTHFPGTSFGGSTKSIHELREEFLQEGLSGAWIMTTDGLRRDPVKHNDILADAVKDDLDFFVSFCTVDPLVGTEQAVTELVRAKEKLGMKGLKLHPWLQSFSLTNPAVLPILKKAGELDMPVVFHDGTPPYSTPLQIAAAAEKVPDTMIILGHTGLDDLWQDAVCACLRQPNIYLCLCSLSSGYIVEVVEQCPEDKLLYGSDGGFFSGIVKDGICKIETACKDRNMLEKIFYDNPQRIVPLNGKDT